MKALLGKVQQVLKDDLCLNFTDFVEEQESKTYMACKFLINHKQVFCRTSKITPKKKGEFVTFYQRNIKGIIEPYGKNQNIDYFIVFTEQMTNFFVFPKSILIKKGILSTTKKEGKRAFRVYTPTDVLTSKQSLSTQKWQSNYFYSIKDIPDKKHIQTMF